MVVVHAPEHIGHTGRDGRLVVVLGPEAEGPASVGLGFVVAPRRFDDVGLELPRAPMAPSCSTSMSCFDDVGASPP